jgi:hypothetical protein
MKGVVVRLVCSLVLEQTGTNRWLTLKLNHSLLNPAAKTLKDNEPKRLAANGAETEGVTEDRFEAEAEWAEVGRGGLGRRKTDPKVMSGRTCRGRASASRGRN